MSIFLHYLRHKKPSFRLVRRVFRLESAIAFLVTCILYTAIAEYLFTPKIVVVRDEAGSCSFLSTDLNDPLRSSLEHAIRHAQQSVVLIIYSLSDKKVISALRDAANRGVDVRVVHDPIETPDCASLLGKSVHCYPRRAQGLMHNKLLSIDHAVVWLGSANMSTRSLTEQGNFMIALHCHAIAEQIEALANSMISQSTYSHPPLHVELSESSLTVFFHPYHGSQSLHTLIDRIDTAKHRVFVAMFTFTHPDLVAALCRAKQRGVDVRVVMDQESSKQTSRKAYLRFKREGIPCGYRTKLGLLHYKTAVIDSLLIAADIGS